MSVSAYTRRTISHIVSFVKIFNFQAVLVENCCLKKYHSRFLFQTLSLNVYALFPLCINDVSSKHYVW